MEFVGKQNPAPTLNNQKPKDPKKFFNKTVTAMKKLFQAKLIHADLSAFNILNHEEQPYFIDFSQATTTKSPGAKALLKRDVKNICKFFKQDQEKTYEKIIKL
jgi:RIO kinase 1